MQQRGFERKFRRLQRRRVIAHQRLQLNRQAPAFQQHGAYIAVMAAQHFVLNLVDRLSRLQRLANRFARMIGHFGAQHQVADLVQQAGDKQPIAALQTQMHPHLLG